CQYKSTMVKASTSNFERLLSSSRLLTTSKKRSPWRSRMKHREHLNAQDRAIKKIRRLEEKKRYQVALQEAQEVVVELANKLRDNFQKHSAQYYLEDIMQISRWAKKRKATSAWQAFISKEVKAINDGKDSFHIPQPHTADAHLLSGAQRRAQEKGTQTDARDICKMGGDDI
ncbi:hypothetical protein C0991_010549, partial [Blastosporella zonata]